MLCQKKLFYSFYVKSGIPHENSIPRDHIVEQMTPITSWGTTFVVTPTLDAAVLDIFKMVAAEDSTEVFFEGETVCKIFVCKTSL